MSVLMSVRAVVKDGASNRHSVLLVPFQVYCYLWDFHTLGHTLVTGLQYKAALRRGYSSSYLTILAHGGRRGQEVGVSLEAAYQKGSCEEVSSNWVRVTSELSSTS